MDELRREHRQALGLAVGAAGLDGQVLALDVPKLTNPLAERVPQGRLGRKGARVQKSDPGNRPGRLRCDGQRRRDESHGGGCQQGAPGQSHGSA